MSRNKFETIGTAAAGIAHDLNNQLMLVMNNLSIRDLDAAEAAVARCCHLTTTLLSYSCGIATVLQPLDPIAFVRDFLAELKLPDAIRCVVKSPAALPWIEADPVALHRVLTNLVLNAATAMKGSGTLRVVLGPGTITVEDSGGGITAENVEHVFEPFFTTKRSAGLGLGLAIVRDIMRDHGGSVLVRSTVGKGARFRLRFKLTNYAAAA